MDAVKDTEYTLTHAPSALGDRTQWNQAETHKGFTGRRAGGLFQTLRQSLNNCLKIKHLLEFEC